MWRDKPRGTHCHPSVFFVLVGADYMVPAGIGISHCYKSTSFLDLHDYIPCLAANCIAAGGHIAGYCQHFDQNIYIIINLPAGHRLEADIVERGIAGEGIAEVVLRRSTVGSTSWRLDESCDCQWCSNW